MVQIRSNAIQIGRARPNFSRTEFRFRRAQIWRTLFGSRGDDSTPSPRTWNTENVARCPRSFGQLRKCASHCQERVVGCSLSGRTKVAPSPGRRESVGLRFSDPPHQVVKCSPCRVRIPPRSATCVSKSARPRRCWTNIGPTCTGLVGESEN